MSQWLKMVDDWYQSTFNAEENLVKQFARVWDAQEAGKNIIFISIVVNTSPSSTNDIMDIGFSTWSKESIRQRTSKHWRIEENPNLNAVTEFEHPDSFIFGTTRQIKEEHIGTVLSDWVASFASQCEELCLIVYGKEPLKILKKHWEPPTTVFLLDLEVVWRLLRNGEAITPLQDTEYATEDSTDSTAPLHHAGNQAYRLLLLLESLGRESKNYLYRKRVANSRRMVWSFL